MNNIIATSTGKTLENKVQRNYEIDFLKLLFSVFIFITHSDIFIGENTRISLPLQFGRVITHFFFIISGMFMVNSIKNKRTENNANYSKLAIEFVLRKIKPIYLKYISATLITATIYICNIKTLTMIFPEIFCITYSGVDIEFNATMWYFSAMIICMLPLAYMLYKKCNFTLYVFAPLASVMLLGYMCRVNDYVILPHPTLYGIVMGGIIRAMCGLCFGINAWTIYNKLVTLNTNKNVNILLTIAETVLWFIFFFTWFTEKNNRAIISILFILPIVLAIAFSQKSYLSKMFRFKWMRYLSSVSLSIYLNHWGARLLTQHFFIGRSYKFCVIMMSLFTVCACILNYLTVKLCKIIWNRKLKNFLTKPDNV